VKSVEWLLPNAKIYEKLEVDEEDEHVDFIDLYESGDEGGNGSEDSDEVYGEKEIEKGDDEDMDGEEENLKLEQENLKTEQEGVDGFEQGEDNVHLTDEGETSGSGLGRRMRDLGHPDSASSSCGLYSDAAEHRFDGRTQEIAELLLGRAMTPRISSQAQKTNRTASKILFSRECAFLLAMPISSVISRQPLGKMQKNKELKLRRWIELNPRWIGRPFSIWLASTSLTA